MNFSLTVIKYLLFWKFSLYLLKDKLGHPIPSGEHFERTIEPGMGARGSVVG
jgi:hypothetical protein